MPSIVLDGETVPLLHVSQLARLLGLPEPAARPVPELAALLGDRLAEWLELIARLDLSRPTASRGRTVAALTVNVFHAIELLPAAWRGGDFPWRPEDDDAREREIPDVRGWASGVYETWRAFAETEKPGDRPLQSSRGAIAFSALLESQLWHVEFHRAQLST